MPCVMDASSLPAPPTTPAPNGLQVLALFLNFFFPALALLVISVRVAGRVAANQFAVDDWLVCVAMLMSIAQTLISFFFIKTNFIGIPPEEVPPHDPTQGLIWSYAVQILYNPILALVKSSVLIFLSRLFGQKDWVRRSLLWLNVANVAQMVAVFFAILLQCLPFAFNWDPTVPGGRCVDRRILYISTAVFNILTDFLILGLPLWVFSGLRIPKRTKIALLIVFLLGFLVTITSITRLLLLVQGLYGLVIFPNSASNNLGFVTSGIETNLALITASAPALRPIFRSRDRGGWFARSVMATTTQRAALNRADSRDTTDADAEAADLEVSEKHSHKSALAGSGGGSGVGGKSGLGGSRAGSKRRGVGAWSGRGAAGGRRTKPGREAASNAGPKISRPITMVATHGHVELRSLPPRSPGEEQVMTGNGIVRVSDIQREIDGIVRDIAVAGAGSYTGTGRTGPVATTIIAKSTATATPTPYPPPPPPPPSSGSSSSSSSSNDNSRSRSSSSITGICNLPTTSSKVSPPPRTPRTPRTPKTPKTPRTPPPRPRPSIETIRIGASFVPTSTLPPSRPSTSGSASRRAPPPQERGGYRERESTYAEQHGIVRSEWEKEETQNKEYGEGDDDEDGGDDRVSRYLDRRFGVVTPRGTTGSTSMRWEGGSGRPF